MEAVQKERDDRPFGEHSEKLHKKTLAYVKGGEDTWP